MALMMPVQCGGGVRSETVTQHRIIVPPGLGSSTPLPPHLTASSSRLERAMPCNDHQSSRPHLTASSSRLERASTTNMRTIKADGASATVPSAGRTYSRSPPPPRTAPLVRTADHRGPSPSPPAGNGGLHAPAIDRTKVQHVTTMQRSASTVEKVPAWARPQGQHTSSTRQLVRLQGEKTWTSPPMVGESKATFAPPSTASSVSAPSAPAQSSRLLATQMTPPLSSGSGFGALIDVDNSPSSTVDLHGATCLRTPSAPDSLLSGTGGLELSDSSSQPSLTISTNSSTKEAFHRPGDGNSQHKTPLSPIPTAAPFVAAAIAPARSQGNDLDTAIPELALCTENANGPLCRAAPQLALQTWSPSLEHVGDENVPPAQEDVATMMPGKESKEAVQVGVGRSGKIAKMCSYWEARMTRTASADALGGSFRERNNQISDSTVLRERQPEAQRQNGLSPKPRHSASKTRSASVSLPRRPGGDSRRCNRRMARQQQLTDDLTTLMQVVCPCDTDALVRSSGSESEEPKEECDDWLRVVERENKILNKHLRQYTRLLTHFLQKRSASCGPAICPHCVTSLTCPECGRSASEMSRIATSHHTQGNIGKSSCADKQVDAHKFERILNDRPCLRHEVAPSALRERNVFRTMDAVNARLRSTSPTSPPTEEPAGEPDSGLLSN